MVCFSAADNLAVAGSSHSLRYFARNVERSLSECEVQVFFFFLTSFVGEEGGEGDSGSSPVVFGPALAPALGAARADLRSPAQPFNLRLSDEAAALPRRFFFPLAIAVNGIGNIIDELGRQGRTECLCNNTKCVYQSGWDEKKNQNTGCVIILVMWQLDT